MGEAGGDAAAEGLPAWRDVPLDGEGGAPPARARPPHEPVESADSGCLQLDGGLCATGTAGGCVHLWSTAGDELEHRRRLPGHEHGVSTLSFQRETGWLVAGTGGGAVRVWSLERCAGEAGAEPHCTCLYRGLMSLPAACTHACRFTTLNHLLPALVQRRQVAQPGSPNCAGWPQRRHHVPPAERAPGGGRQRRPVGACVGPAGPRAAQTAAACGAPGLPALLPPGAAGGRPQ